MLGKQALEHQGGRGPVQVCLQQFAGLSRQGIQRLGLGMLCAYDKQAFEDFIMAKYIKGT